MPERAELWRKTGQRGFLIACYKRLKKISDRAITLWQRQSVSLHTWHCQGPRKPSSCTTFMLNSHWAELPQAKKVLCLGAQGCFGSVQLFATL